jgi:FkbM family methyltransferase
MLREKINVPVVTLGDWAYSQGTVRVDFLWLDLQGGELAALQGASRILPTCHLYSEVSLKPMKERHSTPSFGLGWRLGDFG